MDIILTIFVAVTAFVATNLDDLFVLIAFFARKDIHIVSVVVGQYIGVLLLIILSSFAYFFKFIIPTSYISLLGLLPIAIGLKNLWNLKHNAHSKSFLNKSVRKNEKNLEISHYNTLKVALVTFANGGDNIGVYAPLFASSTIIQVFLTSSIFMAMVGLWCIISYFMVSNKIIGYKLEKYGHIILPFVLIFIGLGVLTGLKI